MPWKNIFMEKRQKDNGSHHKMQRGTVESCRETESKHIWADCKYESTTKGWNFSH